MLYLKRGKTLTYGTRESLTYGISETLIPFEVVGGAGNGVNFEDVRMGQACCDFGFLRSLVWH